MSGTAQSVIAAPATPQSPAAATAPDVTAVRAVVEEHFPNLWPAVNLGLSTCATLLLADNSNPTAVIYVGAPSTGKTTVASMFEGAKIDVGGKPEDLCYRSDKFTPASFVSQAANQTAAQLAKIDLLPQIKNKVLLTPELATIFRGKDDELSNTFSVITRVLDGQGYQTNSGTHGKRGAAGPHLFAWIGCTTPFEPRVWRIMSQLGSRLFFLLMETSANLTVEELVASDREVPYMTRLERVRAVLQPFLSSLFHAHGGVRGSTWDAEADPYDTKAWIARCAMLLAAMRSLPVEERDPKNPRDVIFRPGTAEAPYRARAVLTNVARGHALVHGRHVLKREDIPLIALVTVSSMPGDAGSIFKALVANRGQLTVEGVQTVLRAGSRETARKRMEYLHAVGVMEFVKAGSGKAAYLRFSPDWGWCAFPEFRALLLGEREPVERQEAGVPEASVNDVESLTPEERVTVEEVCAAEEPVNSEEVCASPITNIQAERLRGGEEEEKEGIIHTPPKMTGATQLGEASQ